MAKRRRLCEKGAAMAKKVSATAFAAFLKERLAAKDGYIMCATGQNPKKLSDWWFSGQYSGKQLEKALYWKEHAERVWDCNGLSEGYYKDMTGTDINTRCRYNYSGWCDPKGKGEIPVKYRKPGAALFKKSSYIHHVGYLVEPVTPGKPEGDWYIIEAKGVMYGVVQTKLSDGGWTHWGLMTKYFDYEEAEAQESVRIRVTAAVSAYVRSSPGKDGSITGVALRGREFDCLETAENGWRRIDFKGRQGWISPKMCCAV